MSSHDIFLGLSLIIVLGTAMALFMRLINQPLIIGHIITGILVGPAVFDLIKEPETFETFSSIGIALLLFIVGLGLNPRVISELSKVVAIVGLSGVALTTLIGGFGSLVLGLDRTEAALFGIALSFSSTIIILKLLSDRHEQMRLHGKIIIGVTLVEDLLATLALLFIIAKGNESSFSLSSVGILGLKGLLIGSVMFLISAFILRRTHRFIASSQEFLFLFAIAWGFGSAALFESIGFSQEIGALFAGVLLADLPYAQEISTRLRPLRDFFLVLFFIALGANFSFESLSGSIPLIIFGTVVVVVLKPFFIAAIMMLIGYTKKTAFKGAVLTGQISEFSLIFMALGARQGLVDESVLYTVTFITLLTIAITTYLVTYSDRIYAIFGHRLTFFEKHGKTRHESHVSQRYELVLFGFQKGGHEFLRVFKQLDKPYVVVDYDPEMVDALEHQKIHYIYGDASNPELLDELEMENAKLVVSTITDFETTASLLDYLDKHNPDAVSICMAETPKNAVELYHSGASYVMLPHYIGSEKLSEFIRKVGLKKSEFKKLRSKHLEYIEAQMAMMEKEASGQHHTIGQTILKGLNGSKTKS